MGVPVSISRAQIEGAMAQIEAPGQGIVLLDQELTMPTGEVVRSRHIFSVRSVPGGGVEYYDRAYGGPPPQGEWKAANEVYFYRTR